MTHTPKTKVNDEGPCDHRTPPPGLVSVVIPAHNAGAVLARQLASLVSQQHAPPFEVIVVLNRCSDDTRTVAARFDHLLDLRVVAADGQASAAYARNVGARHALGEVILFCDADDCVGPNWVQRLAATILEEGADYAGGAVVVDRANLPAWAYDAFYSWVDNLYRKAPVSGVERPVGGSLAVRAVAFWAVGGFDETLRTTEDSDLTARLLRAGYRLGTAPDALVVVRPRTTVRSLLRQQRTWAIGTAQLQSKERRLPEPDSWLRSRWKLGKWVAHRILRQQRRNPIEVVVLTLVRSAGQRARRDQWQNMVARGSIPNARIDESELVAPPDAPTIGGLGFRVAARDRTYWVAGGFDSDVLRAIGAVLRPGGIVVDAPAGSGIHAVHAARHVKRGGQVLAVEEHTEHRERLCENLRRHGEEATVTLLTSHTALLQAVHQVLPHQLRDARRQERLRLISTSVSRVDGELLEALLQLIADHPDCSVHLRFEEPLGRRGSLEPAIRLLEATQDRVALRWKDGSLTSDGAGAILIVPRDRVGLITATYI